ncbi:hypothetical protein ACFL6G_01645 [candidate division KSB1 bacterium]
MKKGLTLLLLLLFSVSAFAQESVWFGGSFEEALIAAQKEGKLVLLDFYRDG